MHQCTIRASLLIKLDIKSHSIGFLSGVPSLDMTYMGEVLYPVYHSVHDTYKWLQGLIDPNFIYHLTTTNVAARLLVNTADGLVLPFDVTTYGVSLSSSLHALREAHGKELTENNVTLSHIENAINRSGLSKRLQENSI